MVYAVFELKSFKLTVVNTDATDGAVYDINHGPAPTISPAPIRCGWQESDGTCEAAYQWSTPVILVTSWNPRVLNGVSRWEDCDQVIDPAFPTQHCVVKVFSDRTVTVVWK